MKKYFYYLIVITYYSLTCLLNTAKAQDIQVEGKSYQVVSKQSLTTEVEFVTLKTKGLSSSAGSFIKKDNTYYKTVFTLSQLKSFFSTGKLSSLGKVKKVKIAAITINYIDNGSSLVIIKYNKQEIGFIEISDEKTVLLVRSNVVKASDDNEPGGSTGDPLLDCGVDCLEKYIGCGNSAACHSSYTKCWNTCKATYPSQSGSGGAISYYILPLNNLAIKL
jgi:hypothetical protein